MLRLQSDRCRLCGIHGYDLRSVEEILAARIKILFHLQIKANDEKDKLPKCVCNNCLLNVDNCWKFYLLVHKMQHELTRENYIKEELLNDEDVPSSDEDYTLSNDKIKALDKVDTDQSELREKQDEELSNVKIEVIDRFKRSTEEQTSLFKSNEQKTNDTVASINKAIKTKRRMKIKRKSKVYSTKSMKNRESKSKEITVDKDETWPEYPWWCLTCENDFDKQETFNQHVCFKKRHCYYCVDCSKAFMIYNRLIIHVKQFHWDRLRVHLLCQCDICNSSFHSIEEQEIHRKQVHPDAGKRAEPEMPQYFSLTCRICNKTFSNRDSLKQHTIIHSDEMSHVCDTCGRAFRYAAGLKEHGIRYHTTDEDKLHCDQCGKMFATQGNLNAHMIIHSKDRPYSCTICSKSFKQEYCLKLHKAKHSIEKSHVCETCGKGFNCKGNLRSHRKIHTQERKFKCSYCEKAFKTKVHQLSHERQHTGEQPYSCPVCDKRFTCYGNRIKHMKRMHKVDTQKIHNKEEFDYMGQE